MATYSYQQESDHSRQAVAIRIIVLCSVWFSISSTNNVVGKKILMEFPHPVTLAMVQLVSTAVFLGPTLRVWQIPRHSKIPKTDLLRLILPLAFGKCFSVVSAHISIWRVPVSYAHTVKATMPVFTILLTRVILQEKQEFMVYLSLIPIVLGVLVATVTELSFDAIGLLSALLATLSFSLQNIFTKKAMKDLHINHLRLLQILAKISVVFVLPFWAFMDLGTILGYSDLREGKLAWLSGVMLVNGFLSFLQNMVAFSVLSLVSPLSYAVCTATKRVLVITVSLLLLRNPVTLTNVIGMLTAIFGVLWYNKVKYECNKRKHLLPVVGGHETFKNPNSQSNGYLVYKGKSYHQI